MTKFFIDPIFFNINDNFNRNVYLQEIYVIFSNFLSKIAEMEEKYGRFIKFNINGYLIDFLYKKNPLKGTCNENRFAGFLKQILPYINTNCEDKNIYSIVEDPQICYENPNVETYFLGFWNKFLNLCRVCQTCNKENLEILTVKNYCSKNKDPEKYIDYFTNFETNLIFNIKQNRPRFNFMAFYPLEDDNLNNKKRKFHKLLKLVYEERYENLINSNYEVSDRFWNSSLLFDGDYEIKRTLIELMNKIINDQLYMGNNRKKLHHETIKIDNNEKELEQCYIFRTYRLEGRKIRPRLRFTVNNGIINFYDVINRN